MTGKKGTKHFGAAIIEEVLEMKRGGKTHREISEFFGLDKYAIKELIKRYNRKQHKVVMEVAPRKKGRPRKNELQDPASKDQLIKQLSMENELLRSFLLDIGRR